jgi:putative PEP-CTERM system TPR-repeat lipoprotein
MTVPLISLSEPSSLVVMGVVLRMIARAYRAAGQRRQRNPQAHPRPSRVVPVLAACLMLLASVLTTSCGRDPELAKRAYLESGDAYFAAEKYAEAIVEYKNAVKQDSRFGEALYKLARTYERVKDFAKAYREYLRAADLMPEDGAVQLRAAQVLLATGEFEDAKTRADRLLEKDPRNVQAQILRGTALAGLKDFDHAIAQMEEAVKVDPGQSGTYDHLGALQLAKGDQKKAEMAFKKAVEIDGTSVRARLALAIFYLSTGRTVEGEEALKQTLQIDVSDLTANRALALVYLASNRATEAEPYLKKVAEVSKTVASRLALADYYALAHRWDEAIQILDKVGDDDPQGFLSARTRLATIEYATGHVSEAHKRLDDVLKRQPKHSTALVLKARFLLAEHRLDDALAQAKAATEADPKSAQAQFVLGKIHTATGQLDDAAKALNEVLKLNPRAAAAALELSRVQLAGGRTGDAIQSARQALRQQPDNAAAHLLLARALIAGGDLAQAEKELKTLLVQYPNVSAVHSQAGIMYLAKGDRVAAKRAFERAQMLDRSSIEALSGLVSLDLTARKVADARARVDARLAETPDNARVLMLAAKVYAAGGDPDRAEHALRRVVETDPSNLEAYSMLGHLFLSEQKLDQAKTEFSALATRRPGTAGATAGQTMVALILAAQNRPAEAQKQYEQILAASPRSVVAANNLAWIYAEQGSNLDVALGLAQTAVAQAPDAPETNDTLGWVYYKKGLSAPAIAAFRRSVEKDAANPLYHYHLGLAYAKDGDGAKARQSLEKALALDPNFEGSSDARKKLASIVE